MLAGVCDFLDNSVRNSFDRDMKMEMTKFESAFLCGLIKKFKPSHIMEIGVAAGGTTALILRALEKYKINAILDSYDLNNQYYQNKKQLTGFIARELFKSADNWRIKTGKYLPELLGDVSKKYDFIILDTVHSLPGEILDYLVAIQYASKGAIFVLHDYHLYFRCPGHSFAYSNKVLFDSISANKFICDDPDFLYHLPNIVACQFNDDTLKYINNTFSILSMPWRYIISEKEYEIYRNFYTKYYDKYLVNLYDLAYINNKNYSFGMDKKEENYRKLILTICNQLLMDKNKYNTLPMFGKNYTYLCYPINDNNDIHFEFELSRSKVFIALHFQGKYKNEFNFANEIIERSKLELPLKPVESIWYKGVSYINEDNTDYKTSIELMEYLIHISLPILREKNYVYYF